MPTLITSLVKSLALSLFTFIWYSSLTSIYYFSKHHSGTSNMSSTVFTSHTLPTDKRLMATIGNGFLATSAFSDSVFVSGVYNGRRRKPSHRGRIPSTAAIRMSLDDKATTTSVTYSLDVKKGLFTHRIEGSGFIVEELIYAHRKLQNLLVVEIKVQNSQDEALKIRLSETQGNKSEDLDFVVLPKSKFPPGSSNLKAKYGSINTAEEVDSERVGVAVVWSDVPASIVVEAKTNQTFYFVTAIVATLNTGDYLKGAFDSHKEALMFAKADGLLASHIEAWSELWQQSGIEIEGDLKIAQAVYGSLYYILR